MDFHYPDIPTKDFIHEDKCCTSGWVHPPRSEVWCSTTSARSATRDAVLKSRSDDIKQRFAMVAGDNSATWRAKNDVLHRRQRTCHTDDECARLAIDFSAFVT